MSILSPNMNLPVPTPSVDDGPAWATNIQSSLNIVDAHTHASGSGVPITPDGLNINADLPLNNYNLTLINTLELSTATGTPAALAIYSNGTDLFYKDGASNVIAITSGGSVNAGAGSITGLPSGTAGVAYTALSGTYSFTQATSTAANIDAATLVVRYPGSYPTPSGNYIAIKAPSALASAYDLILPAIPAAQSFMTLDASGNISAPWTVDNIGIEISAAKVQLKALGVTAAKLAADSVTTVKILDSNVTTAKINDLAVTTAKLAAANVTAAKMESSINLPGDLVKENGKAVVVSNTNTTKSLAIIRGYFNSSGTAQGGEGFSSSQAGTGLYSIFYDSAFGDAAIPVCVAGTVGNSVSISSVNTLQTDIRVFNSAGTLVNDFVFFQIIGMRA